jgi:apolipoprotein D and lipocalin family protein
MRSLQIFATTLTRAVALATIMLSLGGCAILGPPKDAPTTVSSVDLERYVGKWYEIASFPAFFNRGLTGVTAEYAILPDGKVSVFNRGFKEALDGPESNISGKARVVDTVTKSKLAVRFDQFPTNLFEGQYWIVVLDPDYQYAAVSDPQRSTLFVLSRTPQMDDAVYETILDELTANGFDISKLNRTPQPS